MITEYPFDEDVTTSEEFEAVLEDFLVAAVRNDIDVRGSSWVCRSDGTEGPDVEVQFIELDDGGSD